METDQKDTFLLSSIPKEPHIPKTGRYGLVFLCCLCLGISYCDRVNLSVAIVPMAEDYEWDMSEKGRLLSGFFYGYILSQIFGAVLSNKVGGAVILGVAAFCWSLLTILVPLAASFGTDMLFLNRIGVGIFEGVSFPVVYHLFALNVPEEERSRSLSIIAVNVAGGAIFAFYFSPIIISHASWQAVFYFFGSLGLLWSFLWFLFWTYNYRKGFLFESPPHHSPKKQFVKLRSRSKNQEVTNIDFKTSLGQISTLLKEKPVLAVLWCHFCHNIGHYVILSWLPTYLDSLGVKGESLSVTCIPYVLIALFAVVFASCADKMILMVKPDDHSAISKIRRQWTCGLFILAGTCMVFLNILSTSSNAVTFVILFLSLALGFGASAPVAGYESAKFEIVEKSGVGIFQGLSNSFATLSGILGVPFVSFLYGQLQSWTFIFWWISFMYFSAALIFAVFGRWNQKIVL